MADGKITIDVNVKDREVNVLRKNMTGLENQARKTGSTFKSTFLAMGAVKVVSAGFNVLKNSIGSAVDRFDTMNKFPKVMKSLGFSTKDVDKSMKQLSDGIDGLPTKLDDVVAQTQQMTAITGDLDKSTSTVLALNNAFLASGASTDDAARGMQQFNQMLSTGTVDLESWKTLQETMPLALQKTAEAMGYTGKSAQRDLYSALKSGKITFEDFQDQLIKLGNGTGDFAKLAKENSLGIKTSFGNLGNAVAKNVANIITKVNDMTKELTGKDIAQHIDSLKKIVNDTFASFINWLDKLTPKIQAFGEWVKENESEIRGWAEAITIAVGAILGIIATIDTINAVTDAFGKLSEFLTKNPFMIWVVAIGILIASFVRLWQTNEDFRNKIIEIWNAIQSTVLPVVETVATFIRNTWDSLKAWWDTNQEAIKATITNVWNTINSIVSPIVKAIADFIQTTWNTLKAWWDNNQNLFKQTVSTVWNSIKTIFTTVTNAIKEIVSTTVSRLQAFWDKWGNSIKTVTKAVWTVVSSAFSGSLKAILTVVSGVMKQVQTIFDTVMNVIKGVVDVALGLIKGDWSQVLNGIRTIVSSFGKFIGETFRNIMDLAGKLVSNGVKTIKEMFNKLKDINLLQIGKDIIQGLIDGITSKVKAVASAVGNIADTVTGGIKKALDIHSPSRVTKQLGVYTGEGFAIGISSTKNQVANSAKALTKAFNDQMSKAKYKFNMGQINSDQYIKELRSIRSEYAKTGEQTRKVNLEINRVQTKTAKELVALQKKNFTEALKTIKDKASANKISTAQELTQLQSLAKQYKKNSSERLQIEKEIVTVKKRLAKEQEELLKKQFDKEKAYIAKKKDLNQLSLTDELKLYEKYLKSYKKGSDQRVYWEEQVASTKKQIHEQLLSINEEYTNKILEANKKMEESEKALNEAYEKALEDRAKSLYSFVGIFDEVKKDAEVSGQQLLNNLMGQVSTFEEWTQNIASLTGKGLDDGLLDELKALGPSAASQIAALNTLSDEQLTQYVELWRKKHELAKQQATAELEGMRQDTATQIDELRKQTAKQLDAYKKEWASKIKEISKGTKNEFNAMTASMNQIGKNTIQGLMAGMDAMTGPLLAQAQSIANSIAATMKSALSIHSPSRVMRDEIGRFIPQGIAQGIEKDADLVDKAMLGLIKLPRIKAESLIQLTGKGAGVINNNTRTINNQPQVTMNVTWKGKEDIRKTMEKMSWIVNIDETGGLT